MKKNYALILFSVLCAVFLVLSSCAAPGNDPDTDNSGTAGNRPASGSGTSDNTESSGRETSGRPEQPGGAGTLVVYFSCTGNTKAVAERIADLTGGDLYEIVPSDPYTSADLNYNNDSCRANREMNDPSARPAIAGDGIDISSYDTVIIGYPIWWGTMPRIINTFLDTYDLSGKTVLPFCTSGSSGVSESVSDLRSAEPDADIKDGLRVSGADDSALEGWLHSGGAVK